ncbi:MAG: hypothetical protein C4K58_02330 [Flavobacteriaceae bacterium]|nr:MAG: hypothetical protein C4K58_02330 [Flavobacteriaceae bacterium]
MESSQLYLIALGFAPRIGKVTAQNIWQGLLEKQIPIEDLFQKASSVKSLSMDSKYMELLGDPSLLDLAKREMEFCQKNNIQIISFSSSKYPLWLKHCPDAPLVLYFKGNYNWLNQENDQFLSVVGTRNLTPYGKTAIEDCVGSLSGHPLCVVSGLAFGADVTAHLAALKSGLPTFGVLGGSLNTAKFANQYNRQVFALPGRLYDKQSEGCHFLIRNHMAELLGSMDQLHQSLGFYGKSENESPDLFSTTLTVENKEKSAFQQAQPKEKFASTKQRSKENTSSFENIEVSTDKNFSELQKQILLAFNAQSKMHIDQLCGLLDLSVPQLLPELLTLELLGEINCLPGNLFSKKDT